jgi:CRP/FNR family transcriptional regulator/CRP/FNR family cyclic AMP-dependent transcriptional regulator
MAPEPIKILKNISLFSEFSLEDLAYVKSILIRKKYKKNETIFYEGDPGAEMFIVRSGQIKILTTSADGKEMILGVLLPGDFFGEMSLLDNQPRSAMAVATAKETELLIIRQEDFLKLVLLWFGRNWICPTLATQFWLYVH